jgi:GR25 family glycosyltransferase involved in LPS biosynthesis
MIDKTYLIHYTKLKERKIFQDKQLIEEKIQATTVTEFDQENFELIDSPLGLDLSIFSKSKSKSEASCLLKHFWVYKDIIEKNYQLSLILEDDAVLISNFNEHLNKYLEILPKDADMFFLGSYATTFGIQNGKYEVFKAKEAKTTDGYLLTNKGASVLNNWKGKVNFPLDLQLARIIEEKNLNVYHVKYGILTQGSWSIFSTAIEDRI